MNTKKPSVFIIEDQETQRMAMQLQLENEGFTAEVAESISDVRRISNNHGENFDVLLIDMRMDKYPDYNEHLNVTGADLVIEFYKENSKKSHFHRPEPLILSAFKEVDLYQKAFSLGAASYLDKSSSTSDVIRQVRVLSVKSILSNRTNLLDAVNQVLKESKTDRELVENVCKRIFGRIFSNCLDLPFVLIVSGLNENGSFIVNNCESVGNTFPLGENKIFELICFYLFKNTDLSKPLFMNEENINLIIGEELNKLSEKQHLELQGSYFVPLPIFNEISLTIGLLNSNQSHLQPLKEMVDLLIAYLKVPIIMFLVNLIVDKKKIHIIERETTIKKLVAFCNNVGSEQRYILEDAKLRNRGDENLDNQAQQQIKSLAEDLYQTARLLEPILERGLSTKKLQKHSTAEILYDSWEEIVADYELDKKIAFTINGDCQIQCEREEIFLIAFRLFSWFVGRKAEIPNGSKYSIKVSCSEAGEESLITFEDNSYQIPKGLRTKMFDPFSPVTPSPTQDFDDKYRPRLSSREEVSPEVSEKHRPGLYLSLYLSQMLVEEKYRGKLRDLSDDLGEKIGHRIEMRIPLNK